VRWQCVTKAFSLATVEPKKRHPRLQPSDRWRLNFDDLAVFLVHCLNKRVLVLPTWATIASWLMWPFHLFTDVYPPDVTGVESRLVCYSFLNCCSHRTYK
jgi:hypothetical protein